MAEEKSDGRGGPQNEGDNQPAEGDENGYDTDEDFSDPEDFVDDISDEELLGDLLRQKPQEHDGIESVIVVDHIPEVGADRLAKLQNVVTKIFSKFGNVITQHYPKDENENTKGYAFLEYASPAQAKEAVKAANGYKLDKNHTFSVNLFSDFDKYTNIPDEWEPPKAQPFKDLGNLKHWLMDSDSHDQYSVIYEGGEKTAIMMNTRGGLPATAEERARWTETYVRWSPRGTYLTTFHGKGIALWGGEHFKQIMRFSHPGVQLIDFSPCERYIVTFSPMPSHSEEPQAIIFWDIRTGQRKRGFHSEAGGSGSWPIFKWSDDGKYFARLTTDTLSVYETPSFGLLDKKSMKVKSIMDFSWSPSDNVIAYWVCEDANVPARVVLLEIPSRQELRIKNLFSVAECKMHWQKAGDYLCVKVDRYSKLLKKDEGVKYAGMYHNFDLFRMREKQIPVDSIECKETIGAFAWEPTGNRFAFVHGESPRINASFYVIRPGKVDLLKTLEKRVANHIFWSPMGQFVVLAGLRSMNGVLEFIDTTDMTVMSQAEHFMATDVEWDPTGRYLSSAVSWWGHKMDNAYWIWNFQGKLLQKQPLERFCQLLWRPRPPTLLSEKHIKDMKKNMKKYSAQFELQDRMSSSKASKELIEKRRKILEEFNKYLGLLDQVFSAQKDERLELRDGVDTDELESHVENFEDDVVEFLVKVDETIVEDSE